jgi:hypothetical protein
MMKKPLPTINVSKLIKISNSLRKEELGLIKMLACKALVLRDFNKIPENICFVFEDFYLSSPIHFISAAKKLEALKIITHSDNTLTLTTFAIGLAGYNGIDTDEMKKRKNKKMLDNNDLLSWYEFLKI